MMNNSTNNIVNLFIPLTNFLYSNSEKDHDYFKHQQEAIKKNVNKKYNEYLIKYNDEK